MSEHRAITALQWADVDPDDFEELCFQLLRYLKFTNRDWFKGPGDRGRDIVAETLASELPGRSRKIKWVIECKRYAGGVSVSDISSSVSWYEAKPEYERFLIITNSHLTTATKDWLYAKASHLGREIHYIEGGELAEFLQKYRPEKYEQMIQQQIGPSLTFRDSAQTIISNAVLGANLMGEWPFLKPDKLIRTAKELRELDDEDLPLEPYAYTFSLGEVHEISYQKNGLSSAKHTLEIGNLGRLPIHFDKFRIYRDAEIARDSEAIWGTSGLNREETNPVRVKFDNGHVKLAEFILREPIQHLKTAQYTFNQDWPYPLRKRPPARLLTGVLG